MGDGGAIPSYRAKPKIAQLVERPTVIGSKVLGWSAVQIRLFGLKIFTRRVKMPGAKMFFGQNNDSTEKGAVKSNVMELGLPRPRGGHRVEQPLTIFVRVTDGVSTYAIDTNSLIVQRCKVMYPANAVINKYAQSKVISQSEYEELIEFLEKEQIQYTVMSAPVF